MQIFECLRGMRDNSIEKSKERKALEQGYVFPLNGIGKKEIESFYNVFKIEYVPLKEKVAFKTSNDRLMVIKLFRYRYPELCPMSWLDEKSIPGDFEQLPEKKRLEVVKKTPIKSIYIDGTSGDTDRLVNFYIKCDNIPDDQGFQNYF